MPFALGALVSVAMTLHTYGLSLFIALMLFTAAGFILPRTRVKHESEVAGIDSRRGSA